MSLSAELALFSCGIFAVYRRGPDGALEAGRAASFAGAATGTARDSEWDEPINAGVPTVQKEDEVHADLREGVHDDTTY